MRWSNADVAEHCGTLRNVAERCVFINMTNRRIDFTLSFPYFTRVCGIDVGVCGTCGNTAEPQRSAAIKLGDRVQQTVNAFRVNKKMAFFVTAQVEWAGADALRGDEHHARGIGNSGSTRYALSCAWSLWSRKCR